MRPQRAEPGSWMQVGKFQLDFRKYILIILALQKWTRAAWGDSEVSVPRSVQTVGGWTTLWEALGQILALGVV